MKDLGTLRETVQDLRKRDFPHLSEALVDAILDAEAGDVDDRGRARDRVNRAVSEHLKAGSAAQ